MVDIVSEVTATAQVTPEVQAPEQQVTAQVATAVSDSAEVSAEVQVLEDNSLQTPAPETPWIVNTIPRGISEERKKFLVEAPLSVNPATRFRQLLTRPGIIVSTLSQLFCTRDK